MTLKEWLEENGDKEVVFEEDGKFSIKETEAERNCRWRPKIDDQYWYVDTSGVVEWTSWDECNFDLGCESTGNVFEIQKEAKEASERLKIRAELLNCGGMESHEMKDLESESYAIICYRPQDGLKILWTRVPGLGVIGFHTKEEAKVAIEKGGETRILKYLFGVEV